MPNEDLAREARDQIRTAFDTLKRSPSPRPKEFTKAQKYLAAAYQSLKAAAAADGKQSPTAVSKT